MLAPTKVMNALAAGSNQAADFALPNNESNVCVQIDLAGGAGGLGGTFKLQASIDGLTWEDISGATTGALTSQTTYTKVFSLTNVAYGYVNCVWTNSAGTGTITVQVKAGPQGR